MLSIFSNTLSTIMAFTHKRVCIRNPEQAEPEKEKDRDYLPSDNEEEEIEEEHGQVQTKKRTRRGRPKKPSPSSRATAAENARRGSGAMLEEAIQKHIVSKGQRAVAHSQVTYDEFVTIRLWLHFFYLQKKDGSQKLTLELWPEGEHAVNDKGKPVVSSALINLIKNVWIPELHSHQSATDWASSTTGRYTVFETLGMVFQRKGHPCLTKEVPLSKLNSVDLRDWEPCLSPSYSPDTSSDTTQEPQHQQYAEKVLQPALPLTDNEDESDSDDEEEADTPLVMSDDDDDEEEEEESELGPDMELLQKYNLLPPTPQSEFESSAFSTLLSAAEVSFPPLPASPDMEEEFINCPAELEVEETELEQMDDYLNQLREGELFHMEQVLDELQADPPLEDTDNTPFDDEEAWQQFEEHQAGLISFSHSPEALVFGSSNELCVQ